MTVYSGSDSCDIPDVDLLTLLFDSGCSSTGEDRVVHSEASDQSVAYSKAQSRTLTKRIAYALRTHFGIGSSGPGKDVVSVVISGQTMSPLLFYGVVAAGGVYSPSGIACTASDFARQIRLGDSQLIVCSHDAKSLAIEAARICGIPMTSVLLLQSLPTPRLTILDNGKDVISNQELAWQRISDRRIQEETLICMLFSSGTSGLPKAVLTSHRNVVAETVLFAHNNSEYLQLSPRTGRPFEYRLLASLPTAHIAGLVSYFIYPLHVGGQVFWMPKFDFASFLEYHRQLRITYLFSVPPIYLAIANSPAVTHQLDTVEVALCAAAPLSTEVQNAASLKLGRGQTFIGNIWGISETTGAITGRPWTERDESGSVGRLLPGISIRILDEDENNAQPGQRGEILVKGPIVSPGYHKNAAATKDAFTDGWFRTGDIGEYRDEKLYIVDRKKDLIKYKALQVAPAELEALLLGHPLILDAAVIGIEGDGTELPRAYIVADQKKLSENEVKDYVKERVANYKQLRGGVIFLDAIPKNPTGKILKKELRALAKLEKRAKL